MLTLTFLAGAPGVALYLADDGRARPRRASRFAGAGIISTFGITIVLSQEYLPTRLATAAGLSIGLSIGLGGVASFAIGRLADSIGLDGRALDDPARGAARDGAVRPAARAGSCPPAPRRR